MKKQLLNPEGSLHDEVVATILVVEDDPEINALMALTLRVEEYEVLQARDGQQALKILAEQTPDLILMDVMMPRLSGYDLARILQEQSATRHIPVIFVTAKCETEDRVRGLEMAMDYVCKPFAAPELIARVRAALRMSKLQEQLRASNQKLVQLATTDSLTGLCNRRHFYLELESEIQRAQRFVQPLSLVIFDLDFFKQINDSWGHAQGDRVLQHFARVLDGARRHIDMVARLGGEEFVALLPGTNADGARVFAEKVRQATEKMSVSCQTFDGDEAPDLHVTVSAGAATVFSNTPFRHANGHANANSNNTAPAMQNDSDAATSQTNAAAVGAAAVDATAVDEAVEVLKHSEPTGRSLARAMASVTAQSLVAPDASDHADRRGSDDLNIGVLWTASPLGEELMRVADRALYRSKARGRNRVVAEIVATPTSPFSTSETPTPDAAH